MGQLGEGAHPVLRLGLGQVAPEGLALLLARRGTPALGDRRHVHLRVPDVEVADLGQAPHRPPVLLGHRGDDRPPLAPFEGARPPGDGEARGEPHHVPLPGPRQRLVEVVDVEEQLAIRGGEGAEVGEVGVAAELHGEAAARGARQVRRHHRRGAAVEGERRGEHPPVAERDELADPRGGLGLEQLDRVRPVARRRPLAVARARRIGAGGLAGGGALDCGAIVFAAVDHRQAATGSGLPLGGSGPACSSSKRCTGRRRVIQNEASVIMAAKRKAVFSAFSWASS